MKKINKSDKFIINIILRVILSTTISVITFSAICSLLIYKLDIPLEYINYLSVFITSICSIIIAFVSLIGVKNNGAVIGILSQIILIIISFLNMIINDNNPLYFLIKLVIMITFGALIGYARANKNKKFKVK